MSGASMGKLCEAELLYVALQFSTPDMEGMPTVSTGFVDAAKNDLDTVESNYRHQR